MSKILIRRGVFEINSSSTHSISICNWNPIHEGDISLNSDIEVNSFIYLQNRNYR